MKAKNKKKGAGAIKPLPKPKTDNKMSDTNDKLQKGVNLILAAIATDERQGRISCSSLERIFACPASFNAEKLARAMHPMQAFETDDSRRGARLHKAMQDYGTSAQDLSEIRADEFEFLDYCQSKFKPVLEDYWASAKDSRMFIERRFWAGEVISGQIDKAIVSESLKSADVFDWKFGTQPVTPASENLQMAGYALLAFANFDVDAVRVHLVSPCAFGRRYSSAIYEKNMEKELSRQIMAALAKAYDAGAPYADDIGAHCQFCDAKIICKKQYENCELVMKNEVILKPEDFTLTVGNFDAMTAKLNICDNKIKEAKSLMEKLKKAHHDFARQNIQNLPNFEFKLGSESLKVDNMGVFVAELISRLKIDNEELVKVLSVSKTSLDELVKAKCNVKAKDLKDFYRELGGCHYEHGKDKLVAIKKKS